MKPYSEPVERAILVAVCPGMQTLERTEEYLAELEFLLRTAGGVVLRKVGQKLERPDTRTYVGSGKLEEVKDRWWWSTTSCRPRNCATWRKRWRRAYWTARR